MGSSSGLLLLITIVTCDRDDMALAVTTFLASSRHRASSLLFSCCDLNLSCLYATDKKGANDQ